MRGCGSRPSDREEPCVLAMLAYAGSKGIVNLSDHRHNEATIWMERSCGHAAAATPVIESMQSYGVAASDRQLRD